MHSKKKIEAKYPWIMPYLPLIYGQGESLSTWPLEIEFLGSHVKGKTVENKTSQHGINIEHMKNDERVKNLNMTEFYIETLPDVFIVYCEYHRNFLFSRSKRAISGQFVSWTQSNLRTI